ncbi:Cytochrome P450 monooxygenase [Lachnellula hyalina]|uniref:Cytochrome P450 monooxygenase n=1 Tax=Lachnellula hyalina TaxID=1316788 RepID=A0A8H8R067_9HELO|nr:Cytochrome P450 monooxygenase [Lachnellula hyalina]TVY25666.1 Cytochrome P450 monooxygenase [Lachnellula hyalina]
MSDSGMQLLPLPVDASYVELHCLDGGSFIAAASKVHAGASDDTFRMYNWAFCIEDIQTGRHVMWDLGLSGVEHVPLPLRKRSHNRKLYALGTEVYAITDGSSGPEKTNIHAHWDHCRPIDTEFPAACAFFGPGTAEHCSPGHLASEDAKDTVQWDGRYFDSLRQTQNWKEFSGPWVRFGAFEKAMDFFGNGSFWIIQAPGHMPGNLCAVAHVRDNQWVVLGSDCCHSRRIFDGLEQFAVWENPNGCSASLQADLPAAKDTISRIRLMETELGCHVAFAHDTEWMKKGLNQTLMAMLDSDMKRAAKERLPFEAVV